jgi:hypothetical protein
MDFSYAEISVEFQNLVDVALSATSEASYFCNCLPLLKMPDDNPLS